MRRRGDLASHTAKNNAGSAGCRSLHTYIHIRIYTHRCLQVIDPARVVHQYTDVSAKRSCCTPVRVCRCIVVLQHHVDGLTCRMARHSLACSGNAAECSIVASGSMQWLRDWGVNICSATSQPSATKLFSCLITPSSIPWPA